MLRAPLIVLLLAVSSAAGCALCESVDDYTYPTYGGRWQRSDRSHGRVGSLYTPVGHDVTADQPTAAETAEPESVAEPPTIY